MRLRALFLILLPLLILVGCAGSTNIKHACPGDQSRIILVNETEQMIGVAITRNSKPTWLLYQQPTIINSAHWDASTELYIFLPGKINVEGEENPVYVDRLTVPGVAEKACVTPELRERIIDLNGSTIDILFQRVKVQRWTP